ncbi:Cell division cycle protein-like protein [Cardamine amara subsp. amara]|uniref:Cell division cycle protein-like protein n=1 Tax=Cardamine amara subsp. amara TaxID=228776 RepID=A0ABD0ZSU3_CARAN
MTVRWRGFSMRGGREKLLVIPSSKAMISFCSPGLSPSGYYLFIMSYLLMLVALPSDMCYSLLLASGYAGRKNNSIQQFSMALSLDPLCWEAYGELCAAEEASSVFGNVASQCLRKTCIAQKGFLIPLLLNDSATTSDQSIYK